MTNPGSDPSRGAARNHFRNPSTTPRRESFTEEYVLDRDGNPMRDRYGRLVRRPPHRSPRKSQAENHRHSATNPSSSERSQRRREETRFDVGAYMASQSPRNTQYQPRRTPDLPRQSSLSDAPRAQYQGAGQPLASPSFSHRDRKPHRRRRRSNPIASIASKLGVIFLALLTVFALFVFWSDTLLTRTDALGPSAIANTPGTNWLLVGSDSRQGLSESEQAALSTGGDIGIGRTDTIMLLHIPNSGKAQLVSIPRDSYVEIPGFGADKINAAFTYGGPQLLATTVEQATGLRIDHYAEIGMGGLANVVDSVGGVEVCLQEPILDPLAGIDLPVGCQVLKGAEALGYVRTRATPMGDLDRVERQREFFAALLNKITSPATLINPLRALPLIRHTAKSFTVNQDDHVWHLGRVALAMSSGVETQTIPVGGFLDTEVGNVVLWDDAGAQQLFDALR
ncbi:MAG: LCP family protein [Corynebacterium sp.]|nr:LCP family protein [Corynebacterium sp.]